MAWVSLTRYEAEEGELPHVCMRCGGPATVKKRYAFTWHPLWTYLLLFAGLIPYIVVAAVLTERARCYVLLCDQHKRHWLIRTLIVWGGFFGMIVVIGLAFLLMVTFTPQGGGPPWLPGLLFTASMVLIAGWLMSIPVCQITAIHPTDVSDRTVTLTCVSPAFIEALDDHRDRRREARRAREEREAGTPSDHVQDPNRPRRPPVDPTSFREQDI
jgi:hypothetical protein